jgi:hypothetical protein
MIVAWQYPLFLKKQASLRQVAGLWIVTENTCDLRKRPVVSWSVPHHVARDKANAAAIDPIRHPNCCNRRLLFPLNHQLNLTETHHNVLPSTPCRNYRAPRTSGPGNSSPSLRSRRQYHSDGWARQTNKRVARQQGRGGGTFSPQVPAQ